MEREEILNQLAQAQNTRKVAQNKMNEQEQVVIACDNLIRILTNKLKQDEN